MRCRSLVRAFSTPPRTFLRSELCNLSPHGARTKTSMVHSRRGQKTWFPLRRGLATLSNSCGGAIVTCHRVVCAAPRCRAVGTINHAGFGTRTTWGQVT
eukprot:sb/3478593/